LRIVVQKCTLISIIQIGRKSRVNQYTAQDNLAVPPSNMTQKVSQYKKKGMQELE
jgi:hypothetical protein